MTQHHLFVDNGKLGCTDCKTTHEIDKWELHEGHNKEYVPMRHILYVAQYCVDCNNGKFLIDEEQ